MAGVLNILSTQLQGNGATEVIGPLAINAVNPVLQTNGVTFGSATFISTTGPVGATVCVIVPPSQNLIQLTLKGITSDTGVPLSAGFPTVIPFFNNAIANTISLTSAAAITAGVVTLYWF